MKTIPLTKGAVAIVDDEDYPRLSAYKWHLAGSGYAVRFEGARGHQKAIYLHRQLIGAEKGQEVDHVNTDKLDDRRCNLRICTRSQNMINTILRVTNKSGFKGVHWLKRERKWYASIRVSYRKVPLGYFDNPTDAARAYNAGAIKYFGEFAHLNVIPQEESNGLA